MARIFLDQVCVDFPVYNAGSRSLKKFFMNVAVGGARRSSGGIVVVRGLDEISLKLQDGERLGLLGRNGSGKTTLLRILSGVYTPTSGNAEIEGGIGSLIDVSIGIDPEATGFENIFLRGALLGMDSKSISAVIDDILEFTELGEFIDMPLRTYSAGMQMRLAFGISTVLRPEILLMDEWLSVGDEQFQQKAAARLRALLDRTNILILATHSRKLILETCNRVIWLEHGRIVADGSPNDICQRYAEAQIA